MTSLPPLTTELDVGLGLTVESAADGVATLSLHPASLALVPDEQADFLHGGAIATAIDTASWYAATSTSPGSWVVSSLQLDALRLARPEPHRVTARCRKMGTTLAVVDVEIAPLSDETRVVALGRVTLARRAA